MSQLPSQHMKKFEVVERSDFTHIISKPHVPTGEVVSYMIPSDMLCVEMWSVGICHPFCVLTLPGYSIGSCERIGVEYSL